MKIGEVLNGVTAVSAGAAPTEGPAPTPAAAPVDRVTTAESSGLDSSVARGMDMAATERGSRLQALTQQVRSGAYRPSASALADQILAEAERDARLAQALN